MFTPFVVGVFSAAALMAQTDTIVDVNGANQLSLENFRGEVVVRSWDRDAVRIQAEYPSSRHLEIDQRRSTIAIEVETDRGMGLSGTVDFELTVPRGMSLSIEGMAIDVDIQGTEGEVDVNTIHGGISLVGGKGSIRLESVNGEILVEGAEGDLDVTAVAGGVTLRNCTGDISVESVGGSLNMEGIRSADVEAGTVGGNLSFEGEILDSGIYTFGTHGGHIWLRLPTDMNASVSAITLAGELDVDFPGVTVEPTRRRDVPGLREKEIEFEVGSGSARLEVETFAGTVHILRAGSRDRDF